MAGGKELTGNKAGEHDKAGKLEERVRLAELKAREAEAEVRLMEAQARRHALKADKGAPDPAKKQRRKDRKAAKASGGQTAPK
jgi:hypothetical protein